MSDSRQEMNVTEMAAEIVSGYVRNNSVPVTELPALLHSVHEALNTIINSPKLALAGEKPQPKVSVRRSVTHDYIICLEDGKRFKSLKRHLQSAYGLTPQEYRVKWGLPKDYPMVAPAYANARSDLAKSMGLGRKAAAAGTLSSEASERESTLGGLAASGAFNAEKIIPGADNKPRIGRADILSSHSGKWQSFLDDIVRSVGPDVDFIHAVASRIQNVGVTGAGKAIDALLDEDNRRIRDRFIAEMAPLRHDDVMRLAQQAGSDGETTLRRWEKEGAVFSVTHHGRTYYPDFQFRNGQPDPTVKAVLDALPPELSDWQRAFWFVSANGWVSNEPPADHLDDPALVLQAARYEGEPVIG